jgi:HK97 family phage major capsid protein
MTDQIHAPRDDLYRAMQGGITSADGKTLTIRLAPHDQWAEIQSVTEGHFMERFSRTAYRKTMAENPPKILFQHGKDPEIGEKPIATTDEAGEDATSPFARGQILDGVPELVRSGLIAGVYGASHRFSVVREKWIEPEASMPHNPKKLPERTISEAQLFELGPVTWPAYAGASVSLRSLTDEMRGLPTVPEAPSLDAAAETPHLEPERRDDPVVVAAIQSKEKIPVDITQYRTRDEMAARRRELDAEITRMAELPGVLADPDQVDWDAKTEERTALDAAITAWDARMAYAGGLAGDPEKTVPYTPPTIVTRRAESDVFDPAVQEPFRYRSTDQWAQAQRDNAMRAAEQATFPQPNVNQDEARSGVQSMLDEIDSPDKQLARRILATGSPIYRRAFGKLASSQNLTTEEQRAASLAVTTDSTGGFAVPFAFDPTMIHTGAWTYINGIRANATVKQIVGTDTWRGVSVDSVSAIRGAESTEQAEQGPTFAQPEILASRVSAFVSYSIEMGMDRPDLGSELASLIAEAKDTEEESEYTLGIGGTHHSVGLFPAHGTVGMYGHINLATDHTLVADDAWAVEAALGLRHRKNAVWFMARPMIRSFQAVETDHGQLFGGQYYSSVGYPTNSAVGATGLELLRYPIIEAPSAPYDYVTAANNLFPVALLVNPKTYYVVDRVGMNVEFIPHLWHADGKLPIGVRGLYAYWRNGAEPVDTAGGVLLVSTANA